MAKYDLSRRATEDLYDIWSYTVDTWSEDQADKYYTTLIKAFNYISSSPYRVGKSYDEIILGLRGYHIRHHMVFYIIQANGRVLIARVLHERRDYKRHL